MARTRALTATFVLLATLLVSLGAGCESEGSDSKDPTEPWRFASEKAPYAINVSKEWKKTEAGDLNQFADLALILTEPAVRRYGTDEAFYLIVIPQKLPQYEDVESPGAAQLKRASLGLLPKRVDQFEVEREGPVTLDDEPALLVLAEGMDGEEPVQYIAAYATRGEWGYQIVAWGPQDKQDSLVEASEAIFSGWEFTTEAPSGEEASSEDDETQESGSRQAGPQAD